jgi:hypothetical protein
MPVFQRQRVGNVPAVVEHKWSRPVLDEGYIPFPKRLLRCLSAVVPDIRDLEVVLAIVDYSRPNLTRPPSYAYLAFNAGITAEEFKDRVRLLEERGLVSASGQDEAVTIRIDGLLDQILRRTDDETRPAETPRPGGALPF